MGFVFDESKREQKLRWGDASGSFTDTVLLCELNSLSLSYRFGKISGSVNYFLTLKSSYFNRRGKKLTVSMLTIMYVFLLNSLTNPETNKHPVCN